MLQELSRSGSICGGNGEVTFRVWTLLQTDGKEAGKERRGQDKAWQDRWIQVGWRGDGWHQ